MSAPVLSWLFIAQENRYCYHSISCRNQSSNPTFHLATKHRIRHSIKLKYGSQGPTLRANPFPEVTDLFCRLPLSTLFYRLEATHLGDLMRLWVRPWVQIKTRYRIFKGHRERTRWYEKCTTLPVFTPYLRVIRFQGLKICEEEKRTLPGTLADVFDKTFALPLIIHVMVQEF